MAEQERLKLAEETIELKIKVADDSSCVEPEKAKADPLSIQAGEQPELEINSKSAAKISNQEPVVVPEQELRSLAMHPNAPESEWLKACTELNRREQAPLASKSEIIAKKTWKRFIPAAVISLVAAAGFGCFYSGHLPLNIISVVPAKDSGDTLMPKNDLGGLKEKHLVHPLKISDYMRESAQEQSWELKMRSCAVIANAIAENEWSEAGAAANLGVSKNDIYNLMRDYPDTLSQEKLNKMLLNMQISPASLAAGQVKYSPENDGNSDEIPYYTRAILLGNNTEKVYQDRAYAHERRDEWELAAADYTHCLQLKPDDPDLLLSRGYDNRRAGNYQAALVDINKGIALAPSSKAYLIRSGVYFETNDFKKALSDCNEGVARMDKQSPWPFDNRGSVEEKLGMMRQALADYHRALETDPTNTRVSERIRELEKKLGEAKS